MVGESGAGASELAFRAVIFFPELDLSGGGANGGEVSEFEFGAGVIGAVAGCGVIGASTGPPCCNCSEAVEAAPAGAAVAELGDNVGGAPSDALPGLPSMTAVAC